MNLQSTQQEAMRAHRVNHAQRTAQSHAAFFLPHLRPGMDLLDLGCGPGTITAGLAEAVAPGAVTGLDADPPPAAAMAAMAQAGVTFVAGDATALPFPDASFDAIFASALLQHLADPLAALREARRVARPGAVIGIVDADWDGEIVHPSDSLLEDSTRLARKLREGTTPTVGKQLRRLLAEAGFARAEGSARVIYYGTDAEVRGFAAAQASLFRYPAAVQRAVGAGWAAARQLEQMSDAWLAWGDEPGAFVARFWCEAVAWVDTAG